MNLNVEDMLTLFFAALGIVLCITYLRWNFKYLYGPEKTDNLFLRGVIVLILSLLVLLIVNSFGRVLEVMGYSSPDWLLSKIRRSFYIGSLIFTNFALLLLCIVTKPSK